MYRHDERFNILEGLDPIAKITRMKNGLEV
jgi:hypothetical protein